MPPQRAACPHPPKVCCRLCRLRLRLLLFIRLIGQKETTLTAGIRRRGRLRDVDAAAPFFFSLRFFISSRR